MHDLIVFYTFIGLVIFFIFIEIYRAKNFIEGTIIAFNSPMLGIETMMSSTLKVELKNGQIVDAEAMSCTLCMGNFHLGDVVYLSLSKNKYIVNLPFRLKLKTNQKRACSHIR
ncbi:MAG TPA: hypothetical protein ENN22_15045 [bacterium]|nr:hypothetical protein [bacterium]